jgi:hypothetical protein
MKQFVTKIPPNTTKDSAGRGLRPPTNYYYNQLDGNVRTSEYHTPGQYGTYAAVAQWHIIIMQTGAPQPAINCKQLRRSHKWANPTQPLQIRT